jgi:hypothetical protein
MNDSFLLDRRLVADRDAGAWDTRPPKAEANDLFRMVMTGNCSITSIRKLIAVPAPIEATLRAYARQYPEDATRVERVLRFREDVAREFEALVESSTYCLTGSSQARALPGKKQLVVSGENAH